MGGSNEEGAQGNMVKDLEKLDLNGHVSDGDVSELVEMREGAKVKYDEDAPVRIGTESAPALGHAESEALKRYSIVPCYLSYRTGMSVKLLLAFSVCIKLIVKHA